jgi:hypothetical protein
MLVSERTLLVQIASSGSASIRLPVYTVNPGGSISWSDDLVTEFFRTRVLELVRSADETLIFALHDVVDSDMGGEGSLLLSLITRIEEDRCRIDLSGEGARRLRAYATRKFKARWVPGPGGGLPKQLAKTSLGTLVATFSDVSEEVRNFLALGKFIFVDPDAKRHLPSGARTYIDDFLVSRPQGAALVLNPTDVVCYFGRERREEMARYLLAACTLYPPLEDSADRASMSGAEVDRLIASDLNAFLKRYGRPLGR